MRHYDYVPRKIKMGGKEETWIRVERVYCKKCHKVKRILPPEVAPYKQYSKDVIKLARTSDISEDLRYEDYPCEMTIKRWRSQK